MGSVQEALEARKKRKENGHSNTSQSYKGGNDKIANALKTRESRMQSNLSNLASDWQKRLNAEVEAYNNNIVGSNLSYGKDTQGKTLDGTRTNRTNLVQLRQEVEGYRAFLGDEKTDEFLSYVDKLHGGYDSYLKSAEWYSQWETEDDYNKYLANQKDIEAKKTFDLEAGKLEIEDLEKKASEKKAIKSQIDTLRGQQAQYYSQRNTQKAAEIGKQIAGLQAQYDAYGDIEPQLAEKRVYYRDAERIQTGSKLYDEATKAVDFGEKSQYVSTKYDKGEVWGKLTSQYGLGYEDLAYEYINDVDGMRSEIKTQEGIYSQDTNGDGESIYEEKAYDYLNDDEIKVYNYYYATQGKDKAQEYLDSLSDTLIQRKAYKIAENVEERNLEWMLAINAGLDQWATGVKGTWNAITGDDSMTDPTAIQYASGMVRENIESDFWRGAYDLGVTMSNQLPSILVGAVTGQVGGLATMGVSVYGNAYTEMINLGYNKSQANTYATLTTAAELGLQSVLGGYKALGGKLSQGITEGFASMVDNAIAKFAIRQAGSMVGEGVEEGLQSILEPLFKSYVTGETFDVDWGEVGYSALLGALSAGVLEGVPSGVGAGVNAAINAQNTYKAGKEFKQSGDIEKLNKFSADTVAHKLAGKVDENTSAYKIGKLLREVDATISEQNKSDIMASLTKNGVQPKDAERYVNAIAAIVDEGYTPTSEQIEALNMQPAVKKAMLEIIDKNSTVNQRMQGYAEAVKMVKKPNANAETAQNNTNTPQTGIASDESGTAENAEQESVFSTSDDGKTYIKSTNEAVSVKEISSIQDGVVKVRLEDGREVDARELDLASKGEVYLYEMVTDLGVDSETANTMMASYNKGKGTTSPENFRADGELAYKYGLIGYVKGLADLNLTGEQKVDLFGLGRKQAERTAEELNSKSQNGVAKGKALQFEGNQTKKNGIIYEGVDPKSIKKDVHKASIIGMEILANSSNLEIHVYESKKIGNNYYAVINGKTIPAPNGMFRDGNQIYIDINAGADGVGTMLYTLSHEVGHFIRQWNAKAFKELGDFLFEHYEGSNESLKEVIDKEIKLLKNQYKAEGKAIPSEPELYEEAYEEVVCNAMSKMFADENAYIKLAELKKQNQSLWAKIGEAIKAFLDKLKKAIGVYSKTKYGLTDRNAAMTKDMATETYNKLQDMYIKAFVEADENYAKQSNSESTNSESSETKYSLSSMRYTFYGDKDGVTLADFEDGSYTKTEGYKQYVGECLNNMRQTLGESFNEKAARKEIEDSIKGIVNVAIAMKKAGYDILDNQAKRSKRDSKNRLLFSSLEPNSDYFTSSDISTICDKRINFADIYDEIVRREEALGVPKGKRFFDNVDNYFVLHKIMADKGLTQPCRQCYVESMRKNLAPMANAFLRLMQETDPNNKANDQLYQVSGKNKGESKVNNAKLRENLLEAIASEEYDITADKLTVEMLTTEDGLAQLKIQAPLIYEAFNSFYGQSKPKLPKSATPFRFGELTALLTDNNGKIKKSLVDKIKSTGGFRLQSYSDFQIQNFADVLQVIFEAGTLGLNGHAYTKVPAFLDATKGTNLKRNISIFMYNDGGTWKIDRNDSFPYDLEKIYDIVNADKKGNTGIIAVVQNENMAAFVMANDNIGYFIPFHKSGIKMGTVRETIVKEGGREIKGYSNIKDHTKQQSEVWASANADHKALTKVKHGINIYEFWDFDNKGNLSKNELIEKNVKAYIDACIKAGYLPKFREYVMNNSKVLNSVLAYSKELGFVSQDATIDDISFKYKGFTIPYGYYKCLGDFGMFTPNGKASTIERLSLKNYNFNEAVSFFSNAESVRRTEILQQIANGKERERYITGDKKNMTTAEIAEEVQVKRNEVVEDVLSGNYTHYSTRDSEWNTFERAKEYFGTTTDFEEAGFILPNGEMLKLTDDNHRGERQYDHRAIGIVYGEKVDLNVNHGFNFESNKHLEDFVRNGGIRFDTGSFDLDMDAGMQLSDKIPLTAAQERTIRNFIEWKKKQAETYKPDEDDFSLYKGSYTIHFDFGADAEYALSARTKERDAWAIKHLSYEGGQIDADRIISDIRHYYQTGETRQPSLVAQFHSKYSTREQDSYSYETLTSKPNMKLTIVGGTVPNNRADVVAEAKKNASAVGKTNKGGNISVYVDDIGRDVFIGTDGLKHGLRRLKDMQNDPNYIVTLKAGEILKNSIQINELIPSKENAKRSYVLIGAAKDSNGGVYIVRSIVNEFNYKLTSMDVLYAINAKKEELAATKSPRSTGNPLSVTNSTISIAELLENVNRFFPDILPESVLRHFGYDARPDGEIGESTLYSVRDPEEKSNRSILANALESAAQNDIERNKLAQYKEKIDLINSEEDKLYKINEQLKELYFAKGAKDAEKIKSLKFEQKQTENRINTYDRQLLNLEASKPLKAVLEREKQIAYKKAEQRGKEALAAYREKSAKTTRELLNRWQESRKAGVEGRHKTEIRNRLKKTIADLRKILNNGTKERNVKIELQDSVSKALALADVLLSDEYNNEAIVRLGVESVTDKEADMLAQYNALLDILAPFRQRLEAMHEEMLELKRNKASETEIEALKAKMEEIRSNPEYTKASIKKSELNKALADVFVRERNRYDKQKAESIMDALIKAYESLQNSKTDFIKNSYNKELRDRLVSIRDTFKNVSIKDMSLKDLQDLYKAYAMVKHVITESNTLFRNGRKEDLGKRIKAVQQGLRSMNKERKDRPKFIDSPLGWLRSFSWNNLRPVDAFDRVGVQEFTDLFWDAVSAQDTYARDVVEAGEVIAKAREKYKYKKWDLKTAKTFKTTNGLEFKLTLGDMMSIYAYSFREQAYEHMTIGGFTFETGKTYKEKKNGVTKVHAKLSETYLVNDIVIQEIINSLSEEQRAYVKELQQYLTDLGAKGNEVARVLYGIDIFTEEHYFPLQSEQDYRSSVEQALNATQTMVSLKNTGMTKATVPHAKNPIVLRAFDDVVLEHIYKMSKYHAYVIPVENLQKVFNNSNQEDVEQSPIATQALISSIFGQEATAYFNQYITDLNGGGSIGGAKNPLATLFGRAKGVAVAANLSVVAQQYFAVVRAMTEIDAKYFIPFFNGQASKSEGSSYEELKKYAPVAVIKEMGGFDVGSNRGAKDYIGMEEAPLSKEKAWKGFQDATMIGASIMDRFGWVTIWKAVKKEIASTRKDLKVGSEEFLQACGRRFSEVVTRTQVYDSVNTRSGFMRSKHESVKYLTSFMGEPTVSVGMCFTSINNFNRAVRNKDKAEIKRTGKKMARTLVTLPIAGILTAVAKSAIQAMRDDDDEETFVEKWVEKYVSNFKSDIMPWTYLPVGRDIQSLIDGWDVERPDMTLIADLIDGVSKIFDEDSEAKDILGAVGAFANLFGIPLKNVIRDAMGFISTIGSFSSDEKTTGAGLGNALKEGWTGDEISNGEQLYEAILNADQEQIDRVKARYDDADKLKSAIRTAFKKHYLAGDIDYNKTIQLLVEYGEMDEDDAYWKLREWDYEIEHGDTEDYAKYNDFYTAVQSGKNLKAVIKQYMDNGVEKTTLASQITSHFKPLYKEMTNSQRASIKGYLLNAYALLGYDRAKKSKDIDKWLEED